MVPATQTIQITLKQHFPTTSTTDNITYKYAYSLFNTAWSQLHKKYSYHPKTTKTYIFPVTSTTDNITYKYAYSLFPRPYSQLFNVSHMQYCILQGA